MSELSNKKLIASDYDKTYHRHDAEDLDNNNLAVQKWGNAGNVFAISTGRDVASMLFEKKHRHIKYDYMISLNGSFIVDSENNVLFKKALDNQLARKLTLMLQEQFGDELIISNGFDGCNFTNKKASETNEIAKEVFERNSQIYTKTIDTALDSEVLLIGCLNDNFDKAVEVRDRILFDYQDVVEVFINLNYINIVPKGISKASGLEFVIEHAQLKKENVAVIGDDLNDIPMLEKFRAYAVENAKDEVKAISIKVQPSVAALIEEMLLE